MLSYYIYSAVTYVLSIKIYKLLFCVYNPISTCCKRCARLRTRVNMEECIYMCVKYFVLIILWLTIFNKCIFDVANVGRSLAFIGRDGFYR